MHRLVQNELLAIGFAKARSQLFGIEDPDDMEQVRAQAKVVLKFDFYGHDYPTNVRPRTMILYLIVLYLLCCFA